MRLHLEYVVIVCVVSKHVEYICIWFYFLELLCCGLIVALGVKASLTLGREEKPWVKELVGLAIEVEKFFSWREDSFHRV